MTFAKHKILNCYWHSLRSSTPQWLLRLPYTIHTFITLTGSEHQSGGCVSHRWTQNTRAVSLCYERKIVCSHRGAFPWHASKGMRSPKWEWTLLQPNWSRHVKVAPTVFICMITKFLLLWWCVLPCSWCCMGRCLPEWPRTRKPSSSKRCRV